MPRSGPGLVSVATPHLRALLSALHRGELRLPLAIAELARLGLQEPGEELLDQLRGLDERAVRAVLVCVLAERQARG